MSVAVKCGIAGIRPLPVAITVRMASAVNRGAPATMLLTGSAAA